MIDTPPPTPTLAYHLVRRTCPPKHILTATLLAVTMTACTGEDSASSDATESASSDATQSASSDATQGTTGAPTSTGAGESEGESAGMTSDVTSAATTSTTTTSTTTSDTTTSDATSSSGDSDTETGDETEEPIDFGPVVEMTRIRLIDPLDDPEHYCVDVLGFGDNLQLDAPLQAHTCKPNQDDQLFSINLPSPGQLSMPAYDRCLSAGALEPGAQLFLVECSDDDAQRFLLTADQTLTLPYVSEPLCVTVAAGEGAPAGPNHLFRALTIESCPAVEPSRNEWEFPGPGD